MAKLRQEVKIQIERTTKKEILDISENSFRTPKSTYEQVSFERSCFVAIAQEAKPTTRSIRCAYCNDSDYSASCEKILDINTRKQMLKQDYRCFACLGGNHRADQCEPTKSCRRYRRKHHQSICPTSKSLPSLKHDPPPPPNPPPHPVGRI